MSSLQESQDTQRFKDISGQDPSSYSTSSYQERPICIQSMIDSIMTSTHGDKSEDNDDIGYSFASTDAVPTPAKSYKNDCVERVEMIKSRSDALGVYPLVPSNFRRSTSGDLSQFRISRVPVKDVLIEDDKPLW